MFTYLKLSKKKLGLIINFNVARLANGIKRMANGLTADDEKKDVSLR